MRPAAAALFLVLAALPTVAQEKGPNLALSTEATPGPIRTLSLAWQLYATGLRLEDPLILLSAVRLAHRAGERPATGWTKDPQATELVEIQDPPGLPRDPASDAALALAMIMAEGDPPLADLAADIEAEIARDTRNNGLISSAIASLAAGATDRWRMPFYGLSRAELAVIGDGTANLDLRVEDESGHLVCLETGPEDHAYCSFTPAWNGYFTATVTNQGGASVSYKLLAN